MFFDTPVYFLFLLLVVPLYWTLRRRQQNVLLLIASYFFYGWWDWRFLLLIVASTLVDFFCARAIAASDVPGRRKLLLAISVTVNLTFLGFFKYFNFFADSFAVLLQSVGLDVSPPVLRILLPPGISFYTFQELAYIVDVYNGRLKPSESLLDYALFITLFPHLIAGPIQRPSHLLPQVQRERTFEATRFADGIMLITSGLFRKCVIADQCALLANSAFNGSFGPPSLPVLALGTYAFAWQIYGDFSGYSDIARGSAQLMGFHFMVNFRQPYLAETIQDFWRRWHISLSTWLRDYLYIPLGGNRLGERKTYRNLFTTMLLGGLWHGANWTFVIWGGIHGSWLAITRFLGSSGETNESAADVRRVSPAARWVRRILVFHGVCLAWVFFRAQSLGGAMHMLSGLTVWEWRPEFGVALVFLAAFTVPLFLVDLWLERTGEEYLFEQWPVEMQATAATVMLTAIALLAATDSNAFIYFQF
jgi:alginate O-acetyltransferase complex protein AlgI